MPLSGLCLAYSTAKMSAEMSEVSAISDPILSTYFAERQQAAQ